MFNTSSKCFCSYFPMAKKQTVLITYLSRKEHFLYCFSFLPLHTSLNILSDQKLKRLNYKSSQKDNKFISKKS